VNASEQQHGVSAAIVCTDPLVTLSAGMPAGIAGAFCGRKGLHFIAVREPLEDDGGTVARDIQAAAAEQPDSRFVVLAPSEFDAYLLGACGIAAFPASAQIFADEMRFKPADGAVTYDAVVRAHGDDESLIGKLSGILKLDATADANEIGRARVALCLSSADAHATEYLLCGLPVVATEAAGGGRYLMPPFCRVVPSDQNAIAAAIDKLVAARLPKTAVRNHVLQLLHMERNNFLIAANKLANEVFAVAGLFPTIDPFAQGWRAQ
jgi:hypothetical protein